MRDVTHHSGSLNPIEVSSAIPSSEAMVDTAAMTGTLAALPLATVPQARKVSRRRRFGGQQSPDGLNLTRKRKFEHIEASPVDEESIESSPVDEESSEVNAVHVACSSPPEVNKTQSKNARYNSPVAVLVSSHRTRTSPLVYLRH